ncbi:alpha/beta fold hydrolase [Sphingobium subterraneum]|uniref:Palmitoyl-protein thioesterase ABHD10, mitochondrial n=1 Tax=Sphingobium subterraneum TaxID=627688 RepID=A0A841J1F5_9SPHN|nr:alpha/beta hydrolase [Sphingobium subterraneum]MBB6124490.1 pimeloyl-ACP methyl ester carboxylesterase [Sphingobium subterraneum]
MTDLLPALPIDYRVRPDGVRLACRFIDGAGPLLVFLPGYLSDMEGSKAQAVLAWAQERGRACLLLDYSGCGSSDGAFEDGSLTVWRDDALFLIGQFWDGPILPIGSSMGGWLALLVALAMPERIAALIGIAAAPDFTDWGFDAEQKAELQAKGRIMEPSDYGDPYLTTLTFWASGEASRLLEAPIALDCPVRLLHGQGDGVVPWTIATRLAARLRSDDVQLLLVKDGDHRLSRETDISLLLNLIDGLVKTL